MLWRLISKEATQQADQVKQFLRDPIQRRKLVIFPLVLLGHVLLVWLLVQNRWLVMSEITIMIQPPVEASVLLIDPANPAIPTDNAITVAKSPEGLDLKTDDEMGISSLSVQNSVPWFNTTQLPDIRGVGHGRASKREATPPRKTTRKRRQTTDVAEKPPEPTVNTPEPRPEVAVIPPPPAPMPPFIPVPVPPPAEVPHIPPPVATGPREIPPLWTEPPAPPPPVLAVLPPTPIQPPPAPAPIPAAAAAAAPEVLAPVAKPTAAAPAPKPSPAAAKAAPEPAPAPPLNLAPAPQLAVPTRDAPAAPQIAADVTVKPVTPAPVIAPVAVPNAAVVSPAAPSTPPTSTPAPEAPRNPMIVEIPRYTRTPADTSSGDGSFKPSAAGDVPRQSGGRVGADANASSVAGGALGMGVPAPAAVASAPINPIGSAMGGAIGNAPPKPLNMTLPRVDPARYGSGPIRQPSFSELANAQLRRGPVKDPMAEAVNSAEKPDCLKDGGMGLLGAPVAAYQAASGKCK